MERRTGIEPQSKKSNIKMLNLIRQNVNKLIRFLDQLLKVTSYLEK